MSDRLCWGVYREVAHSPGRETDDAEILRATAENLAALGFRTELKTPDELPGIRDAAGVPPNLFVMCERTSVVERLAAWARRGVRVVNRPDAIRNTDRQRTLDRFERHAVAFPETVLVETGPNAARKPLSLEPPCWVKRGDVHATDPGDVSYAGSAAEIAGALARLSARGISRAVVQRHVPGDLIKFYGVGGEPGAPLSWFQWFYHRDQKLSNHPFDPDELRDLVQRGAAALGLEVFGGDAIVGVGGRMVLIDLNAWPSFALFRDVAARRIAECLADRFARDAAPRFAGELEVPR